MSEESPERTATAESGDDDVKEEPVNGTGVTSSDVDENADRAQDGTTQAANGTVADEAEGSDADVASSVAEYDEELADDVSALQSQLAEAESELQSRRERIDELESALKRSKADFKNYKQRAKKRKQEIRERATEDFVSRVVSVRDNLVRALDQDEDADIRPGIESTLEEFDRILEEENVSPMDPEPGTAVDPTRHEVLMRVDDEQPEGTVADVFQPGYEMAGSVLREAQVTVSTGAGDNPEAGDDASDGPSANE